MHRIILFTLLLNCAIFPQVFSYLKATQLEDTLMIEYEILGGKETYMYKVDMMVSADQGRTFAIIPKSTWGNIGYGQTVNNNKQVFWEPLRDSIQLSGNQYVVKIKASLPGSSPEPEFVRIPEGVFKMGDPFEDGLATDENYQHEVFISEFEISKFEITNFQYSLFLKKYMSSTVLSGEYEGETMIYQVDHGLKFFQGEWKPDEGFEYHPVIGVTWFGAYEFCRFYNYRLPTEAEWEYAARQLGGDFRYGNGKNDANPGEINYYGSRFNVTSESEGNIYYGRTIQVGGLTPNNLGLFQMSGNVWEWCYDWYASNYYINGVNKNPAGPNFGRYKVIRGGSWYNKPEGVRAAERSFISPYKYKLDLGFRVVKPVNSSTSGLEK